MKKKLTEKNHASVTETMVRDRKIWTVVRTNQIVRFATVPAWKQIKNDNVIFVPNKSKYLFVKNA